MNTTELLLSAVDHFQAVLEGDFDDPFTTPIVIILSASVASLILAFGALVYFTCINTTGGIYLGSSFNVPGEFDDIERMRNEEEDALPKMTPEEREAYTTAKQFQEDFPPVANALGSTLTEGELDFIHDRGIQAYHFESGLEQTSSTPEVVVEDKLDVTFDSEQTNSAILNNPLPVKDNDTVYFEVKLYELDRNALVSIGLATKPYPLFRLPGHNRYSIAYESDGTVRVNQPFYSPSIWDRLIEGDVLGCGFRPRSGTIFFTHNGKKIVEAAHNVKFDMYPILGACGHAKLSVNLGQLGFVFIEANVKKWGFGPVFGTIGVPPAYGKETVNDTVLDKGEELPPNYPSEEETFFGPPALLSRRQQNNGEASASLQPALASTRPSTKPTQVVSKPPSYTDEVKEDDREANTEEPATAGNEVDERLYERRSSTFDLQNNHYNPLSSDSNVATPTPIADEAITSASAVEVTKSTADTEEVATEEHVNEPVKEVVQQEPSIVEPAVAEPDTTLTKDTTLVSTEESLPEPQPSQTENAAPKPKNNGGKKKKAKKGKKKGRK